MCGIIGVIGGQISLDSFIFCLEMLSTRGQEATGLTGFTNGFISEKCQGTAINLGNNLPKPSEIVDLCIGSTRYPTIGTMNGESMYKHLAPFTESTHKGLLSLAFNGNIIFPQVDNEGNDGFLLTKFIKEKLELQFSIYDTVKCLMQNVDGAYSVIAMLGDDKLLALRDPYGIRPLCWGEINGGYAVASETRVLEKIGVEKSYFVPPGGLIIFNQDSYEKHRIRFEKHHHCMFEWTYFSQAPSMNEGVEVYQVRYRLGAILGDLLKNKGITDIDYVIPVPNTSRSAAMGCADSLGIKYADGLIKNRVGRIFIKPTKEERDNAVKNVYENDSIVRGTTLTRVVDLLRNKGAKTIHIGITTPKIRYPCPYGIDMSRPGELLAAFKTEKEIAQMLSCDSLTYMTLSGLIDGIKEQGLCTACLDANYPTPKAKILYENIEYMNEEVRCYEQNIISR
jgi:amidophosphoribosyltransferase